MMHPDHGVSSVEKEEPDDNQQPNGVTVSEEKGPQPWTQPSWSQVVVLLVKAKPTKCVVVSTSTAYIFFFAFLFAFLLCLYLFCTSCTTLIVIIMQFNVTG